MTAAFFRACLATAATAALLFAGRALPDAAPSKETTPPSPNILLIMADDLGFNDLGMNNPEMRTPNINALARQSTTFTRLYTDATCSPTRVGLLTGLDPARLGFRPVQRGFSQDVLTLPKVLSAAGYHTYHIGKWHVGNAIPELSPKQAGFSGWYGFLTQSVLAGPSLDGIRFLWPRYENPWLQTESSPPVRTPGHLTDIVTNKALETIHRLSRNSEPWFINLWYYAPHAPIEPSKRFAKKYPDTEKGRYQALIEHLDFSIGRLTAQLKELGLDEHTLVIFMSDNGGTNFVMDNNYPLEGSKGEFLEGGLRAPMFWRWPARLSAGRVIDDTVSYLDILPTLAHISGEDLGDLSSSLAGVDLWPSINDGAPFPKRYLFWEYLTYNSHSYSVLDTGGRWRLNSYNGVKVLLDVDRPVAMNQALLKEHPLVAKRLERVFEQWRPRQHEVSVSIKAVNGAGAAVISGDGVQRSPGHGGFTFAIGVTPRMSGVVGNATQYVVNHPPYWHLSFEPNQALELDMLGEQLRGPILPNGKCTPIIVSSYYHYSLRLPQNNKAMINLYVNGTRVDSVVRKNPAVAPTEFEHPTLIGFEANPDHLSQLQLTTPRIFNEMFVPANMSTSSSNTIEGLNHSLCPRELEADTSQERRLSARAR